MKKVLFLFIICGFVFISKAQTNLAAGAIITATNTNPAYPIGNLTEGNSNIIWKSSGGGTIYLTFVLANPVTLSSIVVTNIFAYDGVSIELSADGSNWITAATYASVSSVTKTNLFVCPNNQFLPYKHIRLKLGANQGQASVGEVSITETPTLSMIKALTASSLLNPPINAVDGNLSTSWAPYTESNKYLCIELNKYLQAAKIKVTASTNGIQVDLLSDVPTDQNGSILGYYYTMENTEEFYVVDPLTFNKIKFGGNANFYEITVSEVLLYDVGISYTYDDGGNMIVRTLVFPSQKSAKVDLSDTAVASAIERNPIDDKFGEKTVLVYPNPTIGQVKIEMKNYTQDSHAQLQLFTVAGESILRKNYVPGQTSIDISNQPAGTYILNISVGSETHKWTIIKQ